MCVNRVSYHLTKGKIYSADICSDAPSEYFPGKQVFDYYVINDRGFRHGVEKGLFVDIVKVREGKLNSLGI